MVVFLMLVQATAFGLVVYDQANLSDSIEMVLTGELDQEWYNQMFRELVYDFDVASTNTLIERLETEGFLNWQ